MAFRRKTIAIGLVSVLLVSGSVVGKDETTGQASDAKLRIGVYNSRSVATAFTRSDHPQTGARLAMAAVEQAEAAGDQEKSQQAHDMAKDQQNLQHMQVFGNAPIHDILPHLAAEIKKQAREQDLALVVRDVDIAFQRADVKLIDITDELVAACDPTKETLRTIEQLKKHPPLPLEQFPIQGNYGNHGSE